MCPKPSHRAPGACAQPGSLTVSLCYRQAHSLRERLQELSSRAQQWQQLHQDSEQALAMRDEELVVCKVELAFLKEELSKATEQVQDSNRQHHSPRAGVQAGSLALGNDRSWPTGRGGVERTGQGTAYCRSQATKGGGCGCGSSRAEHLVLLKLALFAPLLERSPSAWNYHVMTEVHSQ